MCRCSLLSSSDTRSSSSLNTASDRVLLPKTVRPITYRLTLNPDLEKFTFTVDEEVDLKLLEDPKQISKIVANSKEVTVNEASLKIGEKVIKFSNISYDVENDYVIFDFDNSDEVFSSLKVGDMVTLIVKSTGILNDKLAGFYRSKYYKDGVEKYGAGK